MIKDNTIYQIIYVPKPIHAIIEDYHTIGEDLKPYNHEEFDSEVRSGLSPLITIYGDHKKTKATGIYITNTAKYFIFEGELILDLKK